MAAPTIRRFDGVITCCRFRIRVNSLWLWWYAAIVLAAHTYLMYRAVQACRAYNERPWPADSKPVAELYVYICLLVLSIMCLPFFLLTAIVKVGNYASDGLRLGRDDVRNALMTQTDESAQAVSGSDNNNDGNQASSSGVGNSGRTEGKAQVMWRHVAPLCNALHVAAAFALLLPRILLDAQKIRHGFLPPGEIWRSQLDVIFGRGRPEDTTGDTATLPRLILNQSTPATAMPPSASPSHYQILPISPEFVNWVLALVIYSLRYPAVFWYTRRVFSMVFAFLMFAAVFQYMLAYCSIGILYKYQVNSNMYADLQLVLPYPALIVLYLLTNTFVFVSSISVFSYGYYHYGDAYRKFMTQHQYHRYRRNKLPPAVGCQGYVPHSVATITLMLFVASRATVVYDEVTLYRNTNNKVLLASVVWDVGYMLLWIITWFVFTIKQTWGFRIWSPGLADSTSTDVFTIRNQHARDSTIIQNPPPNIVASSSAPSHSTQDIVIGNGSAHHENIIEADVVDSSPNNQNQALNRSGEKRRSRSRERKSGNVRVTFDEDDIEYSAEDLSRESPRRRSKDGRETPSRRRKRRSEHPDAGEEVEDSRGFRRGKNNAGKNVFGDFPLQVTPENTLTRSYRHSIRDKCGQYYRHSREFQSPPAAQSSPVLGQRNPDHSHEQSPPRDIPPRDIPKRDLPPRDIPPRELPPREAFPSRDALHDRRSGSWEPERPPRPARNISPTSRSQPPQAPQVNGGKPFNLPPKPPPVGGERVLPPLPQTQLSRPSHSQPNSRTTVNDLGLRPPANYITGMVRNNLSGKPPSGSGRGSDRHPNRDLRIIGANAGVHNNKKPEMGRRDSALPSSNETSSNDSTDNVLCSQV